jgi:UDP-perosamine 4-acetyltransferase
VTAPVVVLGAGGHAKVVIELIRAEGGYDVVALLDADTTPRQVLGVPVVGDDAALERLRGEGIAHAFVALGGNALRVKVAAAARKLGYELINAVSPSAVISPTARLGAGVAVMAGAVVNAESRLDDLAILNTRASVDHDCVLGEACHVAPGSALAGGVTVGREAFLGAGTVVIPGIRIGEGAVIGAGACIVKDIPPRVLALGTPARVVRSI